jgi:hypothetical protein
MQGSAERSDEQAARLIDAPSISLQAQLASVEREIKIRRRVYVTRVVTHRMSPAKAQHELQAMEAVAQTLRALIQENAR